MKFCKATRRLYHHVRDLSEEWTYMSPLWGIVSRTSLWRCILKIFLFSDPRQAVKARLVTSPHCAKKNITGTLLKFLATTCWHHLAKGAKRETMLSEKRPNQLVKKNMSASNISFSWCPVPDSGHAHDLHPSLETPKTHRVFPATSVISSSGRVRTAKPPWSSWGESESSWKWKCATLQIGQKSVWEQFLLFSLAPAFKFYCSRKVPEFDLRDFLW